MPSPFPCSPVICECSWKKTQTEKKKKSGLATKTELNTDENKIPDISNLATKTSLTNLSNSVPDISTMI